MRDQVPEILVGAEMLQESGELRRGDRPVLLEEGVREGPLGTDQKIPQHVHGFVEALQVFGPAVRIVKDENGFDLVLETLDLRMPVIEAASLAVAPELFREHRLHVGAEKRLDGVGDIRRENVFHEDRFGAGDGTLADGADDGVGFLFQHCACGSYLISCLTRSISFFAAPLKVASIPGRSMICLYIPRASSYFDIFSYDCPAMYNDVAVQFTFPCLETR